MHQIKSLPFEIKAKADDGSTFEGMASVYHVLDGYNEIVAPGAFKDSVASFLEKGVIRLLHGMPVGNPTKAIEMADGLFIGGTILDTTAGIDARKLVKGDRPVIKSLSIGFETLASMRLENEEAVKQYWARSGYAPSPDEMASAKWGARILTKIRLREVSLVDIPANDRCDITSVKAALSGRFTAADLLQSARLEFSEIKAGRVLSQANWDRLSTHEQALRTCADDLKAMLDAHAMKDADDPDDDGPKSSSEVDIKMLRAQLDLLMLDSDLFAPV